MKKIKANLIKLLSGLSLAAFFVGASVNMTPMTVYAQSHESENDTEGPIINSAISDGRLVVEAYDDSGVAAIYGPGTSVMKSAINMMEILLNEE